MDYTDFEKIKYHNMELKALSKKINKQFKGKKLNISKNLSDISKDGYDFKFSKILVEEYLVEILYEYDEVVDDDIESVECVDWISIDDFIKYVEVVD